MVASETDGRKLRAAERREETRERLLAAAVAVFAEQGFQAGTTKAITRRAGVAEGLLFHYFPTKTDLLLAVLARDPLKPEMERLLAELGDQPIAAALPVMARHWLQVLRAQQPVGLVLFQAAHVDPRVEAAVGAAMLGLTDVLAAYFARHVTAGVLRPIPTTAAAHLLVHALCSLAYPCGAASDAACDRLLDQQVDLLLHGMLASRGAPDGNGRAVVA